ncbi:PQQ-binding-like beta-propeller repeat protein [bacterium]|nr:PQQ-binding-like beta-propeller repeat protein [bacterium]
MKLRNSKVSLKSNLALLSCLLAVFAASCAGKNVHKDLKEDPKILVRKWTMATRGDSFSWDAGDRGYEFSNPVLLENALIFGNHSTGLISLYPTLGQVRWSLQIKRGVVSELAVDRGAVFFGGGDGFVYSVNTETGRVNWRYDLHSPVISKPAVSGGRLFVTTADDTVYALDAGTGKWLWHYKRRSSQSATILGASSPLVDGNEVIVGLSDGFLISLSLNEGTLLWEKKLNSAPKFTDVDAHPVLESGILYVPSYDGSLYALKRQKGEILWRFDSGGSKAVTLDEDKIFMPSSDGTVYALKKDGGKQIWKFELDGGTPTKLIVTDKYVIMGSTHQYLYVLDKATGKGLYRYNVGYDSGFYGSPAYDKTSQRIYTLSSGGNLYAFQIRKNPPQKRAHGETDPYKF